MALVLLGMSVYFRSPDPSRYRACGLRNSFHQPDPAQV
jgi:hypothetical protein